MSKTQTERARELYGDGPRIDENLKPTPTTIVPGSFSDGQPRMGTRPENIHREDGVGYLHPKSDAYREALRERPRSPGSSHSTPPPEAGARGNLHEHVRRTTKR